MRTPHQSSRVAGRPSERGSALIIVLLLILALTAMGLLALRQTSFELRGSRNQRISKQAIYASDGALVMAVDQVGRSGQAYWELMDRLTRAQNRQALTAGDPANFRPSYNFTRGDFVPNQLMFAGPAQTVANCNQANLPPNCQGLESEGGYYSTTDNLPNLSVRLEDPQDGPKAPGFSHSFCFKRFHFASTGTVGETPTGLEALKYNQSVHGARSQHAAHALIGPLDCQGYYR